MEEKDVWYLGERAEQLAIVYLSRRNDLVITRQTGPDYGLDFLVTLTKEGDYTGRIFGVEVKALRSRKQVRPVLRDSDEIKIEVRQIEILKDIPFPVCLFVFTMDNDEGFYKWIKKPVYRIDGTPQLAADETKIFRKLDNEAIDEIVVQVNNWYENRLKIPA